MPKLSSIDFLHSFGQNPALTWYYGSGARLEISGFVLSNHVQKISNLLLSTAEFFPFTSRATVALNLPLHWRSLTWTLAAWHSAMFATQFYGQQSASKDDILGPQTDKNNADNLPINAENIAFWVSFSVQNSAFLADAIAAAAAGGYELMQLLLPPADFALCLSSEPDWPWQDGASLTTTQPDGPIYPVAADISSQQLELVAPLKLEIRDAAAPDFSADNAFCFSGPVSALSQAAEQTGLFSGKSRVLLQVPASWTSAAAGGSSFQNTGDCVPQDAGNITAQNAQAFTATCLELWGRGASLVCQETPHSGGLTTLEADAWVKSEKITHVLAFAPEQA